MIFIKFLTFFTEIFRGSGFTVLFDSSVLSVLSDIWALISYFLPMNTIQTIIGIYLIVLVIKLSVSVWKFILSIIPFA